ncbi:hypothetical protein DRQ09_06275, partial [candidate division KSB1 bacterium]
EQKFKRFLIYHFVKFYESRYYEGFIKSDVKNYLKDLGVKIEKESSVMVGIAGIMTGVKNKKSLT